MVINTCLGKSTLYLDVVLSTIVYGPVEPEPVTGSLWLIPANDSVLH